MAIYGYFDDATQLEPVFDPGLDTCCPVCGDILRLPVKTISLMWLPDSSRQPDRSYFYRTHQQCYDSLDNNGKQRVDGVIIDALASMENVN